jgi:hypothetical protein
MRRIFVICILQKILSRYNIENETAERGYIRMDLKTIVWEEVNCILLAPHKDQ